MSDVFSKAILAVGTYHSPDGTVHVTPERLRHWEREVSKLQQVGYAIPSHFNHANEIDLLSPIPDEELKNKISRSAQATVGKLRSFKVSEDGNSAEILLETLTPSAKEAVGSNAIYVSPVIFPEWKDGAGNQYQDVITSFDLVDHPVDYSQSPFVPAIRMGLGSKPYVLRGLKMSLTSTAKQRTAAKRKQRMSLVLQRMGVDPTDKKPGDDNDADNGNPSKPDSTEPDDDNAPPADMTGDGDYDMVDQVLDLLHEFGVALPEDTNDGNLIQHLRVALTALLRSNDGQSDDTAGTDPTSAAAQPTPTAPMIATMSLQGPALEAFKWAESQYKTSVTERIKHTLETGRCTPAEADQLNRQMAAGAVKLSLADGRPTQGDVEKWLDARAAVPAGTFWTDKQRTESAAKLSLVEPRTEWNSKAGPSAAEKQEATDILLGKKK